MRTVVLALIPIAMGLMTASVTAQTAAEDGNPSLELSDFRPRSMLQQSGTDLRHARFPAVDVHCHFRYRLREDPDSLKRFVEVMDRNQIAVCISLDGRLNEAFDDHVRYLWSQYSDRFVVFANLDFQGQGQDGQYETWACNQPGFVRDMVERLRIAHEQGAVGLKVFKQFGLGYRDRQGQLIRLDDPRFDPIWATCGQLQMPVLIHTADPAAFFEPIDVHNERWEELSRHPDWSFHGEGFPSRQELLSQRNRVIARHPTTNFIGAHVANNPEDLNQVGEWLEAYPNLFVELASRIGELGRQPYSARRFLIEYQDRVLFGTDGPWPEERVRLYWRFLETDDEYFPYSEKPFPPQGFWQIYGVFLPDDVLRKIYFENACRLIPTVREKYERVTADWQADDTEPNSGR